MTNLTRMPMQAAGAGGAKPMAPLLVLLPTKDVATDRLAVLIDEAHRRDIQCDVLAPDDGTYEYLLTVVRQPSRLSRLPLGRAATWLERRNSQRPSMRAVKFFLLRRIPGLKRYGACLAVEDRGDVARAIAKHVPLVVVQFAFNYLSLDQVFSLVSRPIQSRTHRLMVLLDRLVGGRLLPRVAGEIVRYKPKKLFVDAFFVSHRPPGPLDGQGGARLLCVAGPAYERFCKDAGVATETVSTGFVEHDGVREIVQTDERAAFFAEMGLDPSRPMIAFFDSSKIIGGGDPFFPASVIACRAIRQTLPDHQILLKLHPGLRAPEKALPLVRDMLDAVPGVTLLTDYGGSRLNARMIAHADFVVSISTVIFTAAAMGKPVLYYVLGSTAFAHLHVPPEAFPAAVAKEEADLGPLLEAFRESGDFPGLAERRAAYGDQIDVGRGDACVRVLDAVEPFLLAARA